MVVRVMKQKQTESRKFHFSHPENSTAPPKIQATTSITPNQMGTGLSLTASVEKLYLNIMFHTCDYVSSKWKENLALPIAHLTHEPRLTAQFFYSNGILLLSKYYFKTIVSLKPFKHHNTMNNGYKPLYQHHTQPDGDWSVFDYICGRKFGDESP